MESTTDALSLSELHSYELITATEHYGSIEGATRYWSNRLDGELWTVSSALKQRQALISATQRIDALNFVGTKGTSILEFPRGELVDVPDDIVKATYELAMALLKGVKPETEIRQTYTAAHYFGRGIRTDYAYGDSGQEWVLAGIPCLEAWTFLRPYLSRTTTLILRRES